MKQHMAKYFHARPDTEKQNDGNLSFIKNNKKLSYL